jgi:hypothetical protein
LKSSRRHIDFRQPRQTKSIRAFKRNAKAARVAALAEQVSAELVETNDEKKTNQQTWAEAAYQLIRREIIPAAPKEVIVTYGFPKGKRGTKHLGQCWSGTGLYQKAVIFIHPCQWTTAVEVLDTLTHETCHAATPEAGHRGAFKRLALSIGMKGRMTSASAGAATDNAFKRIGKKTRRLSGSRLRSADEETNNAASTLGLPVSDQGENRFR